MTLQGKVALVAGASRGIGADIAKYLAAAGAHVGVAARTQEVRDRRLPGTIHSVTQEIIDAGGTALAVTLNMRDTESINAAVEAVAAEWGRLDILVNNAAIFVPGNLETVQERHIDLSLNVNLRGYIMSMRAAIPHMRAAGGGHIINVSSRGAIPLGPGPYNEEQRSRRNDIFYGAEKIALEHFSQRQAASPSRNISSILSASFDAVSRDTNQPMQSGQEPVTRMCHRGSPGAPGVEVVDRRVRPAPAVRCSRAR
jgi:NAD(P)-dependent dehydrogenase (short-subunit alcohol dehydrogenase family)